MKNAFLPGVPAELVVAAYAAAPGNEIESGKFLSPESSAALAANTFGFFLDRPSDLPPLPGIDSMGSPVTKVGLEVVVRFPWAGGRHPCLDALIQTESTLIGIESKRYEPFRTKSKSSLSKAYWQNVWGSAMEGYARVRDDLRDRDRMFTRLDAGQLFKRAFGLRSAVHREPHTGKKPVLFYLYSEPSNWPDGRVIPLTDIERHQLEIRRFSECVAGDEVEFQSCSYRELMSSWRNCGNSDVRAHASAIEAHFAI